VVTDHGWLLLPNGLPKIDLPGVLAEHKWGRCALLKPGAQTDERTFPWFWNPEHAVALADGIACYRQGVDYAHGGLSLQECLLLELTISPGTGLTAGVAFKDVSWKGLRCSVVIEGMEGDLTLDLRTQAGNANASVVLSAKPLKKDGTGSVVVENDALEGQRAILVLLDASDRLVTQRETVIGGGEA